MKYLKNFLKKIDIHHVFLAIIVVFGFWLRFNNVELMTWEQIGNDESRDMLVAEHIVNYGEKINRGPFAAGGWNWLLNSPIYYYLVALVWKFTNHPPTFMKFWAFCFSFVPIIGYLLGKEIKNKKLGLIIALIFAINGELIYQSRQLLQPFFLPVFSSLFLLMLLKLKKDLNYFFLSIAIIFLLFPLHFHYGVLIILPVGAIWLVKYWKDLLEKDVSPMNVAMPITSALSVSGLWLLLTYRFVPFDQFIFFMINSEEKNNAFLVKLDHILIKIVATAMPGQNFYISIFIMACAIAVILYKVKQKEKRNLLIIFSMAFSAFLMLISNGFVAHTYLLSTLPFFLVILGMGLYKLIRINFLLGFAALMFVAGQMYQQTTYLLFTKPETSFFDQKGEISKIILNDYRRDNKYKKPNFALASLEVEHTLPFDGWGTTGFWYHLEKLTNKKLIKIHDFGLNVSPLVYNADEFYFICDHRRNQDPKLIMTECLNRFIKVRYYLKPMPKKIYESTNFTVWRFGIIEGTSLHNYNFTHQDIIDQ